jgi:hypothetical protein
MIRVAVINQFGKHLLPKDLSAADLNEAASQAKSLVLDCERLVQLNNSKTSATRQGGVPYMS